MTGSTVAIRLRAYRGSQSDTTECFNGLRDEAADEIERLRAELVACREGADKLGDSYNELIMAVGNKYEGETRHQTALRYIIKAEEPTAMHSVACDAARKESK
jgi:hypothetical protein